jgi:predicted nicotinamide N-methyase
MSDLRHKLEQALQAILFDATLQSQSLAATNGMALYLLDGQYPLHTLDADAAKRVMETPLYWLFCWASGNALAQWIASGKLDVKGKTVLDFGSGSGVVAIAAAMAGAKKVIASDIDALSQQAIRLNAQMNDCAIEVIGDFAEYQGDIDLITVADVLYDRDNIPLLEALMQRATALLLADSRVKNFTYPSLQHIACVAGETLPNLGGFDEFFEVNIFEKIT